MKCCISCRHFKDGRMSNTWITPRCTYRGDDSAMYMRQNVCGLDGIFYEPKHETEPATVQGGKTPTAA